MLTAERHYGLTLRHTVFRAWRGVAKRTAQAASHADSKASTLASGFAKQRLMRTALTAWVQYIHVYRLPKASGFVCPPRYGVAMPGVESAAFPPPLLWDGVPAP